MIDLWGRGSEYSLAHRANAKGRRQSGGLWNLGEGIKWSGRRRPSRKRKRLDECDIIEPNTRSV